MTHKNWLTFNAVVLFIYGVSFLVAPKLFLILGGLTVTAAAILVSRILGGMILGHSMLSWLFRDYKKDDTLFNSFLTIQFWQWIIIGGVILIATYNGDINALGWIDVAIATIFSLGFGYLLFRTPTTTGRLAPH